MSSRRKITTLFALIVVGGLIVGIGWLAWRQAVDRTTLPAEEGTEGGLPGTSATPGALATVSSEQPLEQTTSPAETPPPEPTLAAGEPTVTTSETEESTPPDVPTATIAVPEATESFVQATAVPPDESPPDTSLPTPNPTEGVVGEPPTPPGRLAPDANAGPLQIQQIRIFGSGETGAFAGRANVTNTGASFLNGLVISWRILDGANQVLDQGEMTWPSLAPGETATIPLLGSAPFVGGWDRIEFDYSP